MRMLSISAAYALCGVRPSVTFVDSVIFALCSVIQCSAAQESEAEEEALVKDDILH